MPWKCSYFGHKWNTSLREDRRACDRCLIVQVPKYRLYSPVRWIALHAKYRVRRAGGRTYDES